MERPGVGCKPNVIAKSLQKIGEGFSNRTKNKLFDPGEILSKTFERMFHRRIEEYAGMTLTGGDLKAFEKEIQRVENGLASGKMNNQLGRLLYSTEERVRNSPEFAQLYDDFININHNLKGRKIKHDQSFNKILASLREEAVTNSIYSQQGTRDFKKARKEANRLEDEILSLQIDVKNNVSGAKAKLDRAINKQNKFLINGEGKVFFDFIKIIEDKLPKLYTKLKTEYLDKERKLQEEAGRKGKWISEEAIYKKLNPESHFMEITDSPYMRRALVEYVKTTNDMYSVLKRGIDKYIEAVEIGLETKGVTDNRIAEIKEKIYQEILPDKEIGYFPHYNYELNVKFLDNLMPHLDRLSVASRDPYSTNVQSVDQAIESVNTYLTSRVRPRKRLSEVSPGDYSMNFPVVLKRYMDEINRFNFIAHSQASTRKSLKQLNKMFKNGDKLDGYALDVVNEILDLNAAQTGVRDVKHPEMQSFMRAALNLEFTSKLGLNLRSAFRNSSQALLNYVWFGRRGMKEAKELFANDKDLEREVGVMMEKAGIKFEELTPELQEIGADKGSAGSKIKLVQDSKGGYEVSFKKPSKINKIAEGTGWLAGKAGFMMRKVENYNRKTSFKLAFANMYKQLINDANFLRAVEGGQYNSKNAHIEAKSRARNYAIRMTSLLHFDYSTISKNKLMQHPVGQALFQFQHYSVKFFELNKNIADRGIKDLMYGENLKQRFGGENIMRAYRMGLAYFIAPALATAATGVDVGNIVEHNTTDKLKQLWTLFTGDDEEIKKAFYGRGPLTALATGPLISDALAVGEILELWKMDDDSFASLALGYKDYGDATADQKFYSMLRLLNTQIGRSAYSTYPMLLNGNLGMALQTELGLYPTKKAKEYRKKAKAGIETLSPELLQAMEQITQEASKHRKRASRPL